MEDFTIESNSKKFVLPKSMAVQCKMIKIALEGEKDSTSIKIDYIQPHIISMTIGWLKINDNVLEANIPRPIPSSRLSTFLNEKNVSFFNTIILNDLKDLITAADYLCIIPMLDMCAGVIAAIIHTIRQNTQDSAISANQIKNLFILYGDKMVSDVLGKSTY